MIKEIFTHKQKESYGKDNKFHISSIGQCWRKIYLTMKGLYKEDYTAETLRIFEIGNLFHNFARKEIFEKAGNEGLEIVAAEVKIPEQKYIGGKSDLILSVRNTGELLIIDIKSCGSWTYNKILEGEVPQNYINQIQLYLHYFKIKRGFLVFFEKEKGKIAEVEVIYNKALCDKLIAEIEDFMINNIEKNIEPIKTCDGGMFGCAICNMKNGKQWK